MRTTIRSYLVLLVFPILTHAQSVEYSTDTNGVVYSSTVYDAITTTSSDAYATTSIDSALTSSYASSTISTSYIAGSTDDGATTYPPASTSIPAIQTVPFTGQALLIGTCAIARFTMLTFPDGGSIEVPLVGCSDDRPECCPSLDFNQTTPEATSSASASATDSDHGEEPTTSWTATTPSPTPTGVISMLSKAPLSVCPSDMVDIDPVCCPSGFHVYGQVLVGNYPPCVSLLTTAITPDSAVLASITSAVIASLATATTTTTAAPTVSVVITQVFALGLPCLDDVEEEHHGTHLSTGAKAGIGAGIGVLALLIIGFFWGCLAVRHRRRKKMKALQAANTNAGGPIRPESGAYATAQADPKHLSAATSPIGSPMTQQHQLYGAPTPHGFSPAFGYAPPGQMPSHMVQHDQYGQPYGIEPMGHSYPSGMQPYQQSQSPPPPFYPAGTGTYDPGYKPPAEVAGDEIHPSYAAGAYRHSTGMNDSQSQITSTTAVTGSNYQGSEPRPPAELSSHASTRH